LVIPPLFVTATVATDALAVVMLRPGLRATTRSGCGERTTGGRAARSIPMRPG
jgi:hypothetical protein